MMNSNRWWAAQRTSSGSWSRLSRIATNSRPRRESPPAGRGALVEPARGGLDGRQPGSTVDRAEALGAHGIRGDRDPVHAGRHERLRATGADELPVGLEADPGTGRHAGLRACDEPLEAAVEERLPDAVEHQRLEVWEGGRETLERLLGHVAFDQALPGRVLHAHGAVEVAARRDLDEQLGRVRAQVGRHRVEHGERGAQRLRTGRDRRPVTDVRSIVGRITAPRRLPSGWSAGRWSGRARGLRPSVTTPSGANWALRGGEACRRPARLAPRWH